MWAVGAKQDVNLGRTLMLLVQRRWRGKNVERQMKVKNRKRIVIALLLSAYILSRQLYQVGGTFVSNYLQRDTLYLMRDGTFKRVMYQGNKRFVDNGDWYYKSDHIWFDGWVYRGEGLVRPDGRQVLVGFSSDQNIWGGVQKIYFDSDDYYYYTRTN